MQGRAGGQEPPLRVPPAELAASARVEADPDPEADQYPEERAVTGSSSQSGLKTTSFTKEKKLFFFFFPEDTKIESSVLI